MATSYSAKDAVLQSRLKEAYGQYIDLVSEDGKSLTYEILMEFALGEQAYAALQSTNDAEADVELFRIASEAGELSLENIEDDEEWETAAEVFDELLIGEEADFDA